MGVALLCVGSFLWGAAVGPPSSGGGGGLTHWRAVAQRLQLGKSWDAQPAAFSPSPYPLSPPFASSDLTLAESEVVSLITGASTPSLLPSTLHLLRASLGGLAFSLSTLRPALHRDLWTANCTNFVPCPWARSQLRRDVGPMVADADVYADLRTRGSWLNTWVDSLSSPHPPSYEGLFHAAREATAHFTPGETREDQEMAQRFQRELYELQNPADCSQARFLVYDWYHKNGGFGSWQHARAVALVVAFRTGRTLVEAPGMVSYSHAYSECTRYRGLGGCDIFRPASSCTLPPDWLNGTWKAEREAHLAAKGEWSNETYPALDRMFDFYAERRVVTWREMMSDPRDADWTWELHHNDPPHWTRLDLLALPPRVHWLRAMPECWWMRQALSYNMRVTRDAGQKVARHLTRSLRLAAPLDTVRHAYAQADRFARDDEVAHWWLVIAVIKLEWQLHTMAPDLVAALRREVPGDGHSAVAAPPHTAGAQRPPFRLPFLGYTFIRHGDKEVEANIVQDAVYLDKMAVLAAEHGVHHWYVGADNLTSPEHLRNLSLALNLTQVEGGEGLGGRDPLLTLYTSHIVDAIANKTGHPMAGGFHWGLSLRMTDEARRETVWRTLVDVGMAQLSDVFFSTYSSNHPRVAYELAGSVSDARATAPFISLDFIRTGVDKTNKHRWFDHCTANWQNMEEGRNS